ncbi:MAG: DUF5810 domain-containing protein [Halorhabdus sp.]
MGYACPVCEAPQVDARHLANHLAFTALLGDDDHEAWLETHASGWEQKDDEALAEAVVEYAEEVDLPGDASVEHDPGVTFDDLDGGPSARTDPTLDDDAKDVLREAYEMTRKRRERGAEPADADAGETE